MLGNCHALPSPPWGLPLIAVVAAHARMLGNSTERSVGCQMSCGRWAAKYAAWSLTASLLFGTGSWGLAGAAADFQHQTGTRQDLFQHRQNRVFVAFARRGRLFQGLFQRDAVLENMVRKQRYPRQHTAIAIPAPAGLRLSQESNKRWNVMEIRTVRKPGERGTQKLVAQYGPRLVCIRYRYDQAKKKRYKTIELIVAQGDWSPPEPHPQEERTRQIAPKRFIPAVSASASNTKRPIYEDRSRRQAGCGTHRNDSGSSRKKRFEGWDWFRESPSGERYYM